MNFELITCPEWGARPAKSEAVLVPKSRRVIIHHTAGHAANISNPVNESREEAIRYAKALQNYHMDQNGWSDSGHNFLVCRNGIVLQGRWTTITAIQGGKMVRSAHCVGQNDQIGIEHEHRGSEPMTNEQKESSAQLMAWIAMLYRRTTPLPMAKHSQYNATSCPANVGSYIPWLRSRVQQILNT